MSSDRPVRRLRQRVFAGLALLLLVASAVFTANFVFLQKRRLETALIDRGRGLGALLATGAKIAVYSENAELVRETLQGVAERRDVLAAAVFTEDGTLVAAKGRTEAFRSRASRLGPRGTGAVQRLSAESGCLALEEGEIADVFCPVVLRERAPAAEPDLFLEPREAAGPEYVGFVRISLDRKPMRRELALLVLRSLILLAIVLLLGTWAGFHFSRRVTEPLEQLTEAVRAYGAGNGARGIPPPSDDEIGRLAEAFNGMVRDLEERQREKDRLAERLRHAKKMEAVGALSQGVSHDFKNILSSLKAAVHILQKGAPDNALVQKYTERMQATLERARELVERLVVFSRTRELPSAALDAGALLRHLEPRLADAAGERVRLEFEVPHDPLRVLGDPAALEQLLMNLTYNARDAMPQGGLLRVRLEAADGGGAEGGGRVARLTVADTGEGMEPEVRDRAFEPFFTTKEGAGTGLGLSIVRGIVEQHGGRVRVESEAGQGTAFVVELPLLPGDDGRVPDGAAAA